ncbi:Conserved_hypothetical protein [Hexamita inflata]|uniref:Uncharacterized protein n=1 Tax=Hexamita inflata TaxID=28002 RepID=A0AA86QT51_9EUKA|nr:Conserved hypothetical protein [Hexamita inflata]
MIKDDNIIQLEKQPINLMSFSLTGFYGKTNTGKTTSMFKLKDEYIKNSKKQAYDLDKPFVLGGDFTHIYFISPSISSDKTAEKNKDLNMISIEGDKEQVLELIQSIRQMKDDVQELLQLQTQIRDFFKQCDLNKLDQQTAVLLINILKQIEQTKQKYPLLEFEETNQDIRKNLKEFYKLLYLKPITSFIRIPKIMIIMDDMSGTSLFTNSVENEFYKFIVQRRHLHVFTFMISAHSITNLYYQFRVNQTAIVLFNGLKMEQMKEYFNTIQEVQSNNFGEKEFTEIYKQITGYYEQDFDKKALYRYNFLYIVIQPMPSIYKGFNERIK